QGAGQIALQQTMQAVEAVVEGVQLGQALGIAEQGTQRLVERGHALAGIGKGSIHTPGQLGLVAAQQAAQAILPGAVPQLLGALQGGGQVVQAVAAAPALGLVGLGNALALAAQWRAQLLLQAVDGAHQGAQQVGDGLLDRKSTRLNSSHVKNSYAVFS